MKPKIAIPLFVVLSIFLCGLSFASLSDVETAIIREDYPKAQELAQDFIDKKPTKKELDQALYYLGLSQLRQGHNEEARAAFQLLLSGFPNKQLYDKAYLGVIDSFYLNEEFETGLRVAEEFYQKSPQSSFLSLVYLKLARGNLKLAHWPQARKYLEKILAEFPNSFEAHLAKQLLEEQQYFTVQVGAFLDRQRALKLVSELQNEGEYAYIIETFDRENRKFYRVRVGQLAVLKEAQKLQSQLSRLGYPTRIYP